MEDVIGGCGFTSNGDGGCRDGVRGGEAGGWGATTTERAKLRERRGRASGGEGFKYKDTEACAVLSYWSRHSNDSLFSGDVGMHYSCGRKRDARERGAKREGSEERVIEREREEGRQVVPHGVPRHPTMRGCGPPRVEREGERGMKRRWDEEKGSYRGSRRGRRYMWREQERAVEKARKKKRDGERGKVKRWRGLREMDSVSDRGRTMIRGGGGCRMMERSGN